MAKIPNLIRDLEFGYLEFKYLTNNFEEVTL